MCSFIAGSLQWGRSVKWRTRRAVVWSSCSYIISWINMCAELICNNSLWVFLFLRHRRIKCCGWEKGLLSAVGCDGFKFILTHVENSHFVLALHRVCFISECSRAEEAVCNIWLQASPFHSNPLLSKHTRFFISRAETVELLRKYSCLSYINVRCLYCTFLHRWWGKIPVHTLSYSEGGACCQVHYDEPLSSQHRSMSPTLLVLHARLYKNGNSEGDPVSPASRNY